MRRRRRLQQPDGERSSGTMVERIAHRGPDAVGVLRELGDRRPVQLGHRRLSIIDLSTASDQPFVKDGLRLSYNGELYNYREIRAVLEGHGVRFVTRSDTEVVLEAWRLWGPDALPRFRGMFAFALYDERDGELHPGPRPARHQAAVRDAPRRGRGLRLRAQGDRRRRRLRAARRRPGAGGLDAATTASRRRSPPSRASSSCRRGRGCAGRAARPAAPAALLGPGRRWPAAPPAEPEPDLAAVLEESVAAHLVADVPVASFLSGGLDSSLVTAMAHRRDPSIEAYTITFRPRTSGSRRCPTTPSTPGRWPRTSASGCTRSRSARTSSTCCRASWTRSTSRSVTPPRSTPCSCARRRGTRASRCCSPGWAPTSSSAATASTWPACWGRATSGLVPRQVRSRVVAPAVDRLPVAALGRGLRYSRWAKRFLSFAELPEEEAFRRSYTLYDADELDRAARPGAGPGRRRRARRPPRHVHRRRSGGPGQPDVPDRHPALPARAQPRLHRPLEHGGVHRGPGAVRRPGGLPGGVRDPGQPEDPGPHAEGPAASEAARGVAPERVSNGPRPRSARPCGPG